MKPQKNHTRSKMPLVINKYLVLFVYLLFFIANLTYLNAFSFHKENSSNGVNHGDFFYLPLILDQDKSYVSYMHQLEDNDFRGSMVDNGFGIALVYYQLKEITGFSYDDIALTSFIVNNLAILLCYWYFVKVGLQLGFRMSYRWLFFLNPALIYYSQLINKEIFSLLFVLAFTYYLGQKKSIKLFLFSLLSAIIRVQLAPIGFLSFFLHNRRRYLLSLFLIYVVISLAGAILIRPDALENFSREDGSRGLVVLTQILNQRYYIGSLLLNPVKVVQYLYDLLSCFNFVTLDGRVNLYRLRDVPFSLVFLYLSVPLMHLFSNLKKYKNTACRSLITVTLVFLIVMLMNPVVHARYLFPISYNLLFLGVFVSLNLKRILKEKRTRLLGSQPMVLESASTF